MSTNYNAPTPEPDPLSGASFSRRELDPAVLVKSAQIRLTGGPAWVAGGTPLRRLIPDLADTFTSIDLPSALADFPKSLNGKFQQSFSDLEDFIIPSGEPSASQAPDLSCCLVNPSRISDSFAKALGLLPVGTRIRDLKFPGQLLMTLQIKGLFESVRIVSSSRLNFGVVEKFSEETLSRYGSAVMDPLSKHVGRVLRFAPPEGHDDLANRCSGLNRFQPELLENPFLPWHVGPPTAYSPSPREQAIADQAMLLKGILDGTLNTRGRDIGNLAGAEDATKQALRLIKSVIKRDDEEVSEKVREIVAPLANEEGTISGAARILGRALARIADDYASDKVQPGALTNLNEPWLQRGLEANVRTIKAVRDACLSPANGLEEAVEVVSKAKNQKWLYPLGQMVGVVNYKAGEEPTPYEDAAVKAQIALTYASASYALNLIKADLATLQKGEGEAKGRARFVVGPSLANEVVEEIGISKYPELFTRPDLQKIKNLTDHLVQSRTSYSAKRLSRSERIKMLQDYSQPLEEIIQETFRPRE